MIIIKTMGAVYATGAPIRRMSDTKELMWTHQLDCIIDFWVPLLISCPHGALEQLRCRVWCSPPLPSLHLIHIYGVVCFKWYEVACFYMYYVHRDTRYIPSLTDSGYNIQIRLLDIERISKTNGFFLLNFRFVLNIATDKWLTALSSWATLDNI